MLSLNVPPDFNVSLHYLLKCQCLKATIENKTSIATHFYKLATEKNVFIVSVIVENNCHILPFLHQMFNVSALLQDNALLKCVVTEVVLFNVCLIHYDYFEYTVKINCNLRYHYHGSRQFPNTNLFLYSQ